MIWCMRVFCKFLLSCSAISRTLLFSRTTRFLPSFCRSFLSSEVVELVQAQVGQAHGLSHVVCPGLEGEGVLLAFMRYRRLKVGSFHLTIEVVSLWEEPGRLRGHGGVLTSGR